MSRRRWARGLPEQAEEWERTVSEMAEAVDQVREYVRQLEEQAEAESDVLREADGDADRRRLRALPAPVGQRRRGQLTHRRERAGRRRRRARSVHAMNLRFVVRSGCDQPMKESS
jgi:hypothetical protein